MHAQPKNNIESVTVDEFEAYTAAVEQVDFQFTLTSRDHLRWSLHKLNLDNTVHVQKADVGSGNICQGATQRDGYNVFFMRAFTRGMVNGTLYSPESVFLLPPGAEFCITVDGPHEWMSVFIPAKTLSTLNLDQSWPGHGRRQAYFVEGMAGIAGSLWSLIERYLSCSGIDAEVTRAPASIENFKAMLTGNLMHFLREPSSRVTPPKRGRPPAVDWRLMSSVLAVLEDNPESMVTIDDLVRMTCVSERALRRGFQRYFGLPPRKYLQLRRLHQARRLLHAGHRKEITVTGVAAQLGMWDFGRFAHRYRRLFDERPSDTLRRSKRVFQIGLCEETRGSIRSVAA